MGVKRNPFQKHRYADFIKRSESQAALSALACIAVTCPGCAYAASVDVTLAGTPGSGLD